MTVQEGKKGRRIIMRKIYIYIHLPILPYCLDLSVFLTTSVALQFRHLVNPWDLWTPLGQEGKVNSYLYLLVTLLLS